MKKRIITPESEKMIVEVYQTLNKIPVSGKQSIFALGNCLSALEKVLSQINDVDDEEGKEGKDE